MGVGILHTVYIFAVGGPTAWLFVLPQLLYWPLWLMWPPTKLKGLAVYGSFGIRLVGHWATSGTQVDVIVLSFLSASLALGGGVLL